MEPPALPMELQGDESADLLQAQELAASSKFNEVQIKLTSDCQAMNAYLAEKSKLESRKHVAKVMHEKNQLAIGRQVVDTYMTNNCFMALSPEMSIPNEFDKFIRATSVKKKAINN